MHDGPDLRRRDVFPVTAEVEPLAVDPLAELRGRHPAVPLSKAEKYGFLDLHLLLGTAR